MCQALISAISPNPVEHMTAASENPNEVAVPISVAFNRQSAICDVAAILDGVESFRQASGRKLPWKASFGSSKHEWAATVTKAEPRRARRVAQSRRPDQRRGRDLP
jgi:hypothetical protein